MFGKRSVFLMFLLSMLLVFNFVFSINLYSKEAKIVLYSQGASPSDNRWFDNSTSDGSSGGSSGSSDGGGNSGPCEYGDYDASDNYCRFIKYELVTDKKNAFDAEDDCESRDGHLATITSSNENDVILDLISKYKEVIVGGTDITTEGVWEWVTGEDFSQFSYWAPGEPNNQGDEDILVYYYLKWNDVKTSHVDVYVCEYEWNSTYTNQLCPNGYSIRRDGNFVYCEKPAD